MIASSFDRWFARFAGLALLPEERAARLLVITIEAIVPAGITMAVVLAMFGVDALSARSAVAVIAITLFALVGGIATIEWIRPKMLSNGALNALRQRAGW